MTHAIILSGHTASLGMIRALAAKGVPVVVVYYGDHDFAARSRLVSESLRSPHPEKAEEKFIEFLTGCAVRFPGAVLFPTTDETLVAVSRNKKSLESHFRVACADWEITQRIIDKQYTYALAERHGIPAPRTMVPRSLSEAQSCASEIGFPCLVKPCQGHIYTQRFGRKMVRADSSGQLEEAFRVAEDAGLEVMLQELIPGDDANVVNYNSYTWAGKALTEFTAVHVRNGPPWLGSPRVVISRKIPEVLDVGRRLLCTLGFDGYSCTEFKRDSRDGIYKLMEVNGRHNLSTLLAVRCGINFPWLHYLHLTEGIAPGPAEFREEFYWIDLVRDIGFTVKYFTKEQKSAADYLRPYLHPHVFAILDGKDPGPFVRRMTSVVRKAVRKFSGVWRKNEAS